MSSTTELWRFQKKLRNFKNDKKSERDVKYCVIDNTILILQLNSEFKLSPVSDEAGLV